MADVGSRAGWALGGLVGLLVIAGCAVRVDSAPAGPADPNAAMRPDLIVADPAVAAPGAVVVLTFPEETTRGVLFVLEARVDEEWALRYSLFSDGPGAGWRRSWQPVSLEPIAVDDIGVGGPGPDRVLIPETATPGEYRICTGNAGENFCTPIEIAAP